jgi:hypothetical protein
VPCGLVVVVPRTVVVVVVMTEVGAGRVVLGAADDVEVLRAVVVVTRAVDVGAGSVAGLVTGDDLELPALESVSGRTRM